jgi:hypothetical protein
MGVGRQPGRIQEWLMTIDTRTIRLAGEFQ